MPKVTVGKTEYELSAEQIAEVKKYQDQIGRAKKAGNKSRVDRLTKQMKQYISDASHRYTTGESQYMDDVNRLAAIPNAAMGVAAAPILVNPITGEIIATSYALGHAYESFARSKELEDAAKRNREAGNTEDAEVLHSGAKKETREGAVDIAMAAFPSMVRAFGSGIRPIPPRNAGSNLPVVANPEVGMGGRSVVPAREAVPGHYMGRMYPGREGMPPEIIYDTNPLRGDNLAQRMYAAENLYGGIDNPGMLASFNGEDERFNGRTTPYNRGTSSGEYDRVPGSDNVGYSGTIFVGGDDGSSVPSDDDGKKGDKGRGKSGRPDYWGRRSKDEIIELQTMLQDMGYDIGKSGVDGKMGKKTRAALKQFIDDEREAASVRELQQKLLDEGYLDGGAGRGVDGVAGLNTIRAMKARREAGAMDRSVGGEGYDGIDRYEYLPESVYPPVASDPLMISLPEGDASYPEENDVPVEYGGYGYSDAMRAAEMEALLRAQGYGSSYPGAEYMDTPVGYSRDPRLTEDMGSPVQGYYLG